MAKSVYLCTFTVSLGKCPHERCVIRVQFWISHLFVIKEHPYASDERRVI